MKLSESRRFAALVTFLLLTIAFACNWSIQCRTGQLAAELTGQSVVQQFIPERLRSLVAANFWARAEILMHSGPLPSLAKTFQAGSYAGNSDIIPLLQMVIALMPEELPPYQLLSSNLARHMGQPAEGLRVIQRGIMNNEGHPGLHELYAAAAFLKLFAGRPDDDTRKSALKYLTRAGQTWSEASEEFSSDPAFKPQNYAVLQARLLLELGRPAAALSAWKSSGLILDEGTDRLAQVLRDYRDSGKIPDKTDFPGFAEDTGAVAESEVSAQERLPENAPALPLMAMLRLLTGTGLLLLIVLFANRRLAA